MTRAEFLELLRNHNMNESIVAFDDAVRDGYCVRRNYFRWEVCVRERGQEFECIGFPSESSALQYLLDKLLSIYRN